MEWLNYHHLLYFWTVARSGGVGRAAKELRLAPPTISAQIRALEGSLGEKLFRREGRGLALTDVGTTVYRYADEIFALGRELRDTVSGRPTGRPARLNVGVADAVPKLIAFTLLQPALSLPEPVRLVCREGKPDRLLADLAVHAIDVLLTDAPAASGASVRAYDHLLAESPILFFGAPALAARYAKGFPHSLDGAPMLLPADNTSLRRSLDHWFGTLGIRPRIEGEFEDAALLNVFGESGLGLFPAPAIVARTLRRQHRVKLVGRTNAVTEKFYAVSVEKRLRSPAVVAISEAARRHRFAARRD